MAFQKVLFDNTVYQFPATMSFTDMDKIMQKVFQSKGNVLASDKKIREDLERHEGKRNWMYRDTLGNKTIGIGFNMERKGGKALMKRLLKLSNKEVQEVLDGKRELTDSQINTLFNEDLRSARADARSLFPSYDDQPRDIQDVLTNMSFNMGKTTFSKFKNFKKAIEARDYNQANIQMTNSLWFKQVKTRGVELADLVKSYGQIDTSAIDRAQIAINTPISEAELDQEERELSRFQEGTPQETPEEALVRQAAVRKRLGIESRFVPEKKAEKVTEPEFDEDLFGGAKMEPGFFQRGDGTFFELTTAGDKVEHGS